MKRCVTAPGARPAILRAHRRAASRWSAVCVACELARARGVDSGALDAIMSREAALYGAAELLLDWPV